MKLFNFLILYIISSLLYSCKQAEADAEMLAILDQTRIKLHDPRNRFSAAEKLKHLESDIASHAQDGRAGEMTAKNFLKGIALLEAGRSVEATVIFRKLLTAQQLPAEATKNILNFLALSYLRAGEQSNCISRHNTDACIFPIANGGIHKSLSGSQTAIELYQHILSTDPADLASRWLVNIAYMTLGTYPHRVPKDLLIPGLDLNTSPGFKPFKDIGPQTGLDTKDLAGGAIVEDFDNDGYLDVVTSSWSMDDTMHYFRNLGNGTFEDLSVRSRLNRFKGGLNMMQADYNNDGFKDIFVLRGGWMEGPFGEQPNSLLRNNRDGTFTDVTLESGLLSFHPTQTATWNDFNNDGWLDVFIGNETGLSFESKDHPCELFINNRDGSFTEMTWLANCNIISFVKGVTSGDFDNDGWQDIFVSTMNGKRFLLKNEGLKYGSLRFTDVTAAALLDKDTNKSFPTWFWDYDNDGWLDIFVGDYTFTQSLAYYAAADLLNKPLANKGQATLYKNNQLRSILPVTVSTNLTHR